MAEGWGTRAAGLLLPGVRQIREGRLAAGAGALAVWGGLWWLVLARWDRIAAAPSGGWSDRVALAALLAAGVGLWTWSRGARGRSTGAKGDARGPWARAAREFGRNRLALAGAFAVAGVGLAALLAPFLAPFDPTAQGDLLTHRLVGPGGEHLLGTDQYGRDVLSRLVHGARVSLAVGFVAVPIAVTIGTLVGAVAGFAGGRVDAFVMRCVDVVISFPRLVLLVTVIALFEPDIVLVMAVLGLTQWPGVARIVRGEVLSLREREYVEAGRALGFSRRRIVLRHLVPNVVAPVVVAATLGLGDAIVLEAGLSFLGLGVQAPTASWGIMVAEGRANLLGAWWIATFPGFAIVLTVLSFNLAGDGLRDALDPRAGS